MNGIAIPPLKTHHGAFALLMLSGLLLSVMLAPSQPELALMYLKSERLDDALSSYEALYEGGNRSVAVVIPLARVYQRLGSVQAAIEVLEDLLAQRPNNAEALDLLADAYRDDQRPYEQMRMLARLAVVKPSVGRLADLSALYNYFGDYSRQIDVLKQLHALAPDEGQYVLDLARMLAAENRHGEASTVISEWLARANPNRSDQFDHVRAGVDLQVHLYLVEGNPDAALAWAIDAVANDPRRLADYVGLFEQRAFPTLAVALLRRFSDQVEADDGLFAHYLDLLTRTGDEATAFSLLSRRQELGRLNDELGARFADLAYGRKLFGLALSVAGHLDLGRLPPWLLEALLESAIEARDEVFIARFEETLGAQYLSGKPLLAARLALFRGDRDAALRWLAQAAQAPLDFTQQTQLAQLYLNLKQPDRALAVLRRLAGNAGADPRLLAEMAPIYLSAGRIDEGLTQFAQLRKRRPDPSIEYAWAMLASAAGRDAEVAAWLETSPLKQRSLNDIYTLYYAAADRGHARLALRFAQLVQPREKAPDGDILLAQAELAAGQPVAAMTHLRPWLTVDADDVRARIDEIWQAALLAAWEKGEAPRADVLAYLDARLHMPGLTRAQRRGIGFQFLELGEKARAEGQFQKLAEGAAADSADVRQLLFLWGPLPQGKRLDWLERQARSAAPDRREGWWKVLRDAGASDRLEALLRQLPESQHDRAVDDWLLDAIQARPTGSERDRVLDDELLRQAARSRDPARVEVLANRARAAERSATALTLWDRLLSLVPDHRVALRELGLAAFANEDRQRARELLHRYHSRYTPDWETRYFLAEALTGLRLRKEAEPEYREALKLLAKQARDKWTRAMRVAEAQSLSRIGDIDAALDAYEALHRDFPNDYDLRADYVALLLEHGYLERARAILDGKQ
ncbi:MAG: tetratricopeptide repeat protein [Gammaproteobacteria bacterium]|nr:tetratricopeptide repeat protein [Gammaproteobacteria bacterium]MCP5136852.1 tetratricopeptide repeat protein [Gammaproteobacteria bacterium]